MTALGPIMVATSANKLWGWRVEVIDENNYRGPRDSQGLPDHCALQKENPAAAVGFYCGLTSTMDRVYELAKTYRRQNTFNIAGGWHAHYCAEEALRNNINVVVHGDGELAIQQILRQAAANASLKNIAGISFLSGGEIKTNGPEMLAVPDLNDLPRPDLGLLKHANKIRIYPLGRQRGCGMNCEFCSVKGKCRWASPEHLFGDLNELVEKWGASNFFVSDDRLEEDLPGTMEFFRLVAERYAKRLRFSVQVRLEAAKNHDFLRAMRKAGVETLCVGYESPSAADLKAMRKGLKPADMVRLTKIFQEFGFKIHMMLIFGYPPKDGQPSDSAQEMVNLFKDLIRQAKPNTVQIMHPVPLVGTDLRQRLGNRIFPLDIVPWDKYDGSWACFQPTNMTLAELQEIPLELMSWFYSGRSGLVKGVLRTLALPVDYYARGWQQWHRDWYREWIKYGGHRLIQQWKKRQQQSQFLKKLEKFQSGEI